MQRLADRMATDQTAKKDTLSASQFLDEEVYLAAVDWAHDVVKKNDFMAAGRAYEKASHFVPSHPSIFVYDFRRTDRPWDESAARLRVLGRAWQYYAEAKAPTERFTNLIRSANEYGFKGWDVRREAMRLVLPWR